MTNETTASQPKSIGDDAQFINWLKAWSHEYENRLRDSDVDDITKQVAAYIDSRAQAAQASATIQAAPDESQWVDRCSYDAQVDEWAIERSNLEADAATANRKSLEFKRVSDEQRLQIARLEIALQRAATIQEPVMVAEPVGVTQFDDDWIEKEVFAEFDRNVHKSSNDVIRAVIATAIQMMPGAAPMVADPAGVALTYPCWSCKKPYTLDQRSYADGRCPHCDVDIDLELDDEADAATVKAVPSEALEVTCSWCAGDGWVPNDDEFGDSNDTCPNCKGCGKIAAPLADKTGGATTKPGA